MEIEALLTHTLISIELYFCFNRKMKTPIFFSYRPNLFSYTSNSLAGNHAEERGGAVGGMKQQTA